MKKQVVVLGAGMVGSAVAGDLAGDTDLSVQVADVSTDALERVQARYGVRTLQADLSTPAGIHRAVEKADVVVGSLSSSMGLATLQTMIETGRPYCDISFMAQDAWALDELAKRRGMTAVVDMGVAPGVSNLLCGHAVTLFDACERLEIYVGGLPIERRWPYQYKAPFAPSDVIEEYTRPARLVEHGALVTREALSEPELLDFPEVGTLEAFNSDGLRSLAYTLKVPFMKEKTLRYPGHIELMRALRHLGLFSAEPIEVGGQMVRPLDVTSALLFPQWMYEEGEPDLTVLRIVLEGKKEGARVRHSWELIDRYDAATGVRSMSRTTGYAASCMARLMLEGKVRQHGVLPPERLSHEPGLVDRFLALYEERGLKMTHQELRLS
jgi:lysine 6-dehydrogenase